MSHYNNNHVGAVKRLDAISARLTELDYANAPTFMITGSIRYDDAAELYGRYSAEI